MLRHLEQASSQQQKQDSAHFDIRDMKTSDIRLSDVGISRFPILLDELVAVYELILTKKKM